MRRTPPPVRSRTRRSTPSAPTSPTAAGQPAIGNNSCGVRNVDDPDTPANEANTNNGSGPRGAATDASLTRQEAKLVHTINALDASVIALEEMENSIKLPGETNRDEALAYLVGLLNDAAGPTKWKYVKSPSEATNAGAVAEQDVIRTAFIYQPAPGHPGRPVGHPVRHDPVRQRPRAAGPGVQGRRRAQQRRVRRRRQPLQVQG